MVLGSAPGFLGFFGAAGVAILLGIVGVASAAPAGEPADVTGMATFERYNLTEPQPTSADSILVGIKKNPENWSNVYWDFNATTLKLTEHSWRAKGYAYANGDYEYESHDVYIANPSATMDLVREQSFLTLSGIPVAGGETQSFWAALPASRIPMRPSPELAFTTRTDADGTTAGSGINSTSEQLEHETFRDGVDNLLADYPAGLNGLATFRGNLQVSIFDANFTIHDADGNAHEFSSGYFRSNGVGKAPIVLEDGAVHDYEIRKYTLELENATFRLHAADRPVQINALSATYQIEGDFRLFDALGQVSVGGTTADLVSGSVSVNDASASLHLEPAVEAGASPRLSGDFHGTAGEVLIDGRPIEPSSGSASTFDASPWLAPWAWVGLSIITAAGAGFALVTLRARRMDPDRLAEAAERALIQGDFPATLDLADRALRRDGEHLGAHVIKAMGLLRVGRPQEAVDVLEDAQERVDDPEGVLDLMTIVGLSESGRDEAAAEALGRAADRNPGILEDLADTDLLSRLIGRGRRDAAAADDPPGEVGYA